MKIKSKTKRVLIPLIVLLTFSAFTTLKAQNRQNEVLLEKNWRFAKGDYPDAAGVNFDASKWETVTIPHDWAIYGPFDRKYDLQTVAIIQNGEKVATEKTGRTGGLPYIGVGWYRNTFDVNGFNKKEKQVTLLFDGAMSEARVYVNGKEACFWPCGYNSFHYDVTGLLNTDGKNNVLAVRLENRPESSRWYPGAGLYRNVHVITTGKIHVPVWGTYITTPYVSEHYASIRLLTEIANSSDKDVRIITEIADAAGNTVASKDNTRKINHDRPFEQHFTVNNPQLWSPENPYLYYANSKVYVENELKDEYTTRFGIRDIKFVADKGFYLNGQRRKFQGVCNHHDLGSLGAAVNEAALHRQLTLLKDMGCDAIRTSHNMPAPELVRLCDETGFMMIIENFDEWDIAKCKNGYHRFFNEWAEKDMVNMLHHFRNHPSVVMWSIGNEVPTQCSKEGYKVAAFLQDICHREDPTRPVTCGMDQVTCVLNNGFAAMLDIPGFNYRAHRYVEAYGKLPQNLVLGSETSSTVSSRGVYKFPVEKKADALYDDHQSSSYDLEYCSWSNIPDEDFALADDYEWTMGQFVWTGFDYLGEPSPYDTDAWPNHSSMFGIIDLAGIPKDRYYLYRSVWNKNANTLHILPHWNWKGREGQETPVFVYTNYPSAELFVNGKSQGRKSKNDSTLLNRYRLMWMDVRYEPGEIKVIAYNDKGNIAEEKTVKTAGKPHHIELIPDRKSLTADGRDLAYINVRIVDKDGNLCPHDSSLIRFTVTGVGKYRASANGDPTCLNQFHKPEMPLFNGQLTAIIQASEDSGDIIVEATAKGIGKGRLVIQTAGLK
jgi:beta-galactosidase